MSWYYTREPGTTGEVLTDEGTPDGMVLSEVLRSGPVPLKVGLELVAAMADVLTIAEEDKAYHGDLKPGMVRVDAKGAVSIEEYGVTRRGGRAPEGRVQGAATDIYGLGVVLHAVLSSESMGAVPRERDAHDDHVVSRLLSIDWGEMSGKRWVDPVVHFLCSMLAHAPGERPAPLDVANILGEVASQVPGDDLVAWAGREVAGGSGESGPTEDAQTDEEELTGPQSLGRAVSQTGAFTRRQAGRAKGECTAFWSREKIAAMLDESEAEPAPIRSPRPRGGTRTPPPPPVVPPADPTRRRISPPLESYPQGTPASPDVTITGQPTDVELERVIASFRAQHSKSKEETPKGAPGVRPPAPPERQSWSRDPGPPGGPDTDLPMDAPRPPAPPLAIPPPEPAITHPSEEALRPAPPPLAKPPIPGVGIKANFPPHKAAPAEEPAPSRDLPWMAIGIGVGGFAIAMALVVLAGVIYYVNYNTSDEIVEATGDMVDSAAFAAAEEAKERETQAKSKRKPRKRTDRSKRRKPEPPARVKAKADVKPPVERRGTTGTFVVQFKSPNAKTRLECGDGQVVEFIGTTRRTFSSVTTCRVRIGEATGAVQVREPAVVRCVPVGARVQCRRR